jgi:hypothetical protein
MDGLDRNGDGLRIRFTAGDFRTYTRLRREHGTHPPNESDDMKTSNTSATVVFAFLIALLAEGALAHHSFAMFDNKAEKTLTGTIKEFQWTNPHIWVQVMVKDEATGKDVEWSIEGGSPNNLGRRGWSRNTLKNGDQVVVVIHPLKNGEPGGSLVKVSVNGKPVE